MFLYQCPNCKKLYNESSNLYYCPKCRYRLKKIEQESLKNASKNTTSTISTVECPYCHSTNTKKISGTGRWLSTGIFGLASGKIGKQWHCNSCKSDF